MNVATDAPPIKVLFVDDELAILKSVKRMSRQEPWDVKLAESGEQALKLIQEHDFDVIVSDMRMPKMDGAALLKRSYEISPQSIRIILSGYSDAKALQEALNEAHIFKYLTKPWTNDGLRSVIEEAWQQRQSALKNNSLIEESEQKNKTLSKVALIMDKKAKERDIEVDQAMSIINAMNEQAQTRLMEALNVLNQIVEWKEGRDAGHSRFVAHYAEKIAQKLGWDDNQTQDLVIAAMLHRIGMLCLPEELASKPYFSLSVEEREKLSSYPSWGEKAIKQISSLKNVAKIIRHHREFVNGKGIPDQLAHTDIPIESRIICLLGDYFDAFNGRLDKQINGIDQAKAYISSWAGKRYDTSIVNCLLGLLEHKEEHNWPTCYLRSNELKEGMIIHSDVIASNGLLLLKEGSCLTKDMIQHIIEFEKHHSEEYDIHVAVDTSESEKSGAETL